MGSNPSTSASFLLSAEGWLDSNGVRRAIYREHDRNTHSKAGHEPSASASFFYCLGIPFLMKLAGLNIKNFVIVSGAYQRLSGEDKTLDQRAEGDISLGDAVLERIPKINKVEVFYYQTDIDKRKDRPFFYQSPTTYWGYRLGCEVIAGAFIVWETRYGWVWEDETKSKLDQKSLIKLYETRYIPGQTIYLETRKPHKSADVVIDNNDFENPRIKLKSPGG